MRDEVEETTKTETLHDIAERVVSLLRDCFEVTHSIEGKIAGIKPRVSTDQKDPGKPSLVEHVQRIRKMSADLMEHLTQINDRL